MSPKSLRLLNGVHLFTHSLTLAVAALNPDVAGTVAFYIFLNPLNVNVWYVFPGCKLNCRCNTFSRSRSVHGQCFRWHSLVVKCSPCLSWGKQRWDPVGWLFPCSGCHFLNRGSSASASVSKYWWILKEYFCDVLGNLLIRFLLES